MRRKRLREYFLDERLNCAGIELSDRLYHASQRMAPAMTGVENLASGRNP
jgi:hypothetical protein